MKNECISWSLLKQKYLLYHFLYFSLVKTTKFTLYCSFASSSKAIHLFWWSINMQFASILDFIREDLLAHFSFPFWLHIMIGQLTGCSKKRAKADWLMTCAKADWLRTNVLTFFLLSDWLVQNLPLF